MEPKMIAANSEETVWKRISTDLGGDKTPLQYHVLIYHDTKKVQLDIDVDPGGGFEGGFESTIFTAVVPDLDGFSFALNHEDFVDAIGKFFGMKDSIIGYPEFDEKLIVKTNDPEKVKNIFADESVRQVFQSLTQFTLHTGKRKVNNTDNIENFIILLIDKGIWDIDELRKLYSAFVAVLTSINEIIKKENLTHH
jgi:hypothetical protein